MEIWWTKRVKSEDLETPHKRLDPKSDIDRLYVSRKEGEKGLVSC